jgi:FkbM family methyltransferase
VDCNGLRRGNDRPTSRVEPECKIDVGAVEREALVEPARLSPRTATIGIGAAARRYQERTLRCCLVAGFPGQPDEGRQRHVERQPDAVDRQLIGSHGQGGDSANPRVVLERRDDTLEEISPTEGIVVQQHDDVTGAGGDPVVRGACIAWIGLVLDEPHLRKLSADVLGCSVGRRAVRDDDVVRNGLLPEMLEAASCELPPLMRGDHDVDGRRHGGNVPTARGGSRVAPEIRSVTIARVSLFGQEPEAWLLGAFIARLEHRSVIDVGAERGGLAVELLRAGSEVVHVIDPEPENAAFLRERFSGDARVTVHENAISNADGELSLHKSVAPDGKPVTFGHTLLERPDTDEIAWRETIPVTARSLASLVDAGEIPSRIGVLKVDTEGHDLAVVSGMGGLDADVVMVEHWTDLPHSLGACPWTIDDMHSELRPRGFEHYAFIAHRGEFVILQWDDGHVPHGHMGNLVFVHERALESLALSMLALASSLATRTVEVGEMYSSAAWERLAVINGLKRSRWLGGLRRRRRSNELGSQSR